MNYGQRLNADTEARTIVDAYCRAHDYTLITREQAARVDSALTTGAVPWDIHKRALDAAEARIAELETELREWEAGDGARGAVLTVWTADACDQACRDAVRRAWPLLADALDDQAALP